MVKKSNSVYALRNMKRTFTGVFLLLFCLLVTAEEPRPEKIIVIRAKRMLDVESGKWIDDAVIVVRGDRIEAAGQSTSIQSPAIAETIDLTASSVLPGLIDAHVHLAWKGLGGAGVLAGTDEAKKTLLAGFTTVRNLGSTGKTDLILRDAIDQGKIPGPRMIAAGTPIGEEGGVCDAVFEAEGRVRNQADAIRVVQENMKQGATVIKLCAGGKVVPDLSDQGATELSVDEIRAIVAEAHKSGRKVAAHAQGPEAISNAVSAGVDSIEHGSLVDEKAARLMKERNIFLVPTLYRIDWISEQAQGGSKEKPEAAKKRQENREAIHKNIRRAIQLGVPIAFGTDATVIPHGWNAREFKVLVEAGLSPLDAIRTATQNAAKLIGWSDQVGSIKPGLFADLIAVEGDPLTDVTVLEKIKFVMKGGIIYQNTK